jgi:hypothetical protein
MGFSPFRAFPFQTTLPGSSPGGTLPAFSPAAPKSRGPRPQGFASPESPSFVQQCYPLLEPDALLGFSAPTDSDCSGWSRLSTTHPPMTSASGAFSLTPYAGLRRVPPGRPGISRSHERLPSQRFRPSAPSALTADEVSAPVDANRFQQRLLTKALWSCMRRPASPPEYQETRRSPHPPTPVLRDSPLIR